MLKALRRIRRKKQGDSDSQLHCDYEMPLDKPSDRRKQMQKCESVDSQFFADEECLTEPSSYQSQNSPNRNPPQGSSRSNRSVEENTAPTEGSCSPNRKPFSSRHSRSGRSRTENNPSIRSRSSPRSHSRSRSRRSVSPHHTKSARSARTSPARRSHSAVQQVLENQYQPKGLNVPDLGGSPRKLKSRNFVPPSSLNDDTIKKPTPSKIRASLAAPIPFIDIPAEKKSHRSSKNDSLRSRKLRERNTSERSNRSDKRTETHVSNVPSMIGNRGVASSERSVKSCLSAKSGKSAGSSNSASRRRPKPLTADSSRSALSAISEVLDYQKSRDGASTTRHQNKRSTPQFVKSRSTRTLDVNSNRKKFSPSGVFQPETNSFFQFDVQDGSVKQRTIS